MPIFACYVAPVYGASLTPHSRMGISVTCQVCICGWRRWAENYWAAKALFAAHLEEAHIND